MSCDFACQQDISYKASLELEGDVIKIFNLSNHIALIRNLDTQNYMSIYDYTHKLVIDKIDIEFPRYIYESLDFFNVIYCRAIYAFHKQR